MKDTVFESKTESDLAKYIHESKPERWEYYIRFDESTLKCIYGVLCHYLK